MRKKSVMVTMLLCLMVICPHPGNAFVDWFFSGSASRDAIDNSAMGDIRAWWTGNPAYQFNPYWSGSTPPPGAAGSQQPVSQQGSYTMGMSPPQGAPAQYPQPQASYYPPQQPQMMGYPQPGQAPAYGGYQQPVQQPYQPAQAYPGPPQQYQAAPQQYQQAPMQYQPQAQYPAQAPQQYPPMTGGYPGGGQ